MQFAFNIIKNKKIYAFRKMKEMKLPGRTDGPNINELFYWESTQLSRIRIIITTTRNNRDS